MKPEPSFDVPLVNVTVVAGQSIVLQCSIDNLGHHKVNTPDKFLCSLLTPRRRHRQDYVEPSCLPEKLISKHAPLESEHEIYRLTRELNQWLKWFCEARLEQTPYPFQPH